MLHRFILNCIVLSLLVSCASYGPKGKYGGTIGIIPVKDNILNEWIIREVVSNGPASLAGLKVNDVILEINGKKTDDFSHRKFTKTIRGQAGSIVKLNIQRNADISYFTVKRAYVSHNSNLPDRPYIPKNMNL